MLRRLPPPQRRIRTVEEVENLSRELPRSSSGAEFWNSSPRPAYRDLLWRIWDDGKTKCVFIMLNPSIADAHANDPTIKRCIGFARRLGYGGFYVVNLFSRISTDPNELRILHSGCLNSPLAVHYVDDAFRYAKAKNAHIICGWGSHSILKDKLRTLAIAATAEAHDVRLYCLGINKDGNPKHPLYVKGDEPLKRWPKGIAQVERLR